MNDPNTEKKLDRIAFLLTLNLVVMTIGAVGLVGGLLPQIIKVAKTAARVEQRFQEFADEVQPVVAAGAGKAIEAITKVDADRLSDTATESSDQLIRSAGERAKRFLDHNEARE